RRFAFGKPTPLSADIGWRVGKRRVDRAVQGDGEIGQLLARGFGLRHRRIERGLHDRQYDLALAGEQLWQAVQRRHRVVAELLVDDVAVLVVYVDRGDRHALAELEIDHQHVGRALQDQVDGAERGGQAREAHAG